jgi:hypothetical protein
MESVLGATDPARETTMNKRIVYTALAVTALAVSMQLSQPQVTATARPTPVPAHVMTIEEQCATVSDPIPNCVEILSGRMAPAAFKEASSKGLDYGPNNSTMNTHIFETEVYNDPRVGEAIRDQMDVDRATYGLRVAQRHLDALVRDQISDISRRIPYNGR